MEMDDVIFTIYTIKLSTHRDQYFDVDIGIMINYEVQIE